MNDLQQCAQDWARANHQGLNLAAIIERSLLTAEQRHTLASHKAPGWPLMYQPEVAPLRNEGPLLLDLSGQSFEHLCALHQALGPNLAGWLSSLLPARQLATHLGDALACQDADNQVLMIRSYSAEVLPLLHQQAGQPWHHWLFGPVDSWWLESAQGWQRFAGLADNPAPDYQPIRLDPPMMHSLQHDAQAERLLEQTQNIAPEVFTSDCHGDRLQQVQVLLENAREQQLEQPQDQSFFVLYSLLSRTPLHQRHDWPDIHHQVTQQHATLESVLATLEGA